MPFPDSSITDTVYRGVNLGNIIRQVPEPAWDLASPFGSYNYCYMPHPRRDQYDPVENGKLLYVEYIQRHQKRTPYNLIPGDAFFCDGSYQLTGNRLPNSNAPAAHLIIETPTNEFTDINGTCQYPQLTAGGLMDAEQHGRDLWGVYGELLGLLPVEPGCDQVKHRASNSRLTEATANGVMRGIWTSQFDLPLYQQPADYDTVNAGFSCPKRDALKNDQRKTQEWNDHLNEMQPVLTKLNQTFDGIATGEWEASFDHFCDNFQAKLCNGYPLDLDSYVVDPVFNAGDWEWNYYWTSQNATDYIKATSGPFIAEIIERLRHRAKGLVFSHTFAHDGDIGPLSGALGIQTLRWPGMGSNIAIEVWSVNNQQVVRVLYCGAPIRSRFGYGDGIPLGEFVSKFSEYALVDKGWCE